MTLNDLCVRFKVIDSLNAAKNGEIQLSNDSDAMYSGWMHYICYIEFTDSDSSTRLARVCL